MRRSREVNSSLWNGIRTGLYFASRSCKSEAICRFAKRAAGWPEVLAAWLEAAGDAGG